MNGKIDDLQHRIESTQAEEDPLKTSCSRPRPTWSRPRAPNRTSTASITSSFPICPQSSITKRLPLQPDGRFSWPHLEKDNAFSEGERSHAFWIFARAIRPDGRQYWTLAHFSIKQNSILPMLIAPGSFVSTKAILRPDLSPEEQQQ